MSQKTDKLTAQQLANALGKNVDTIRKHAKAGKIKGYQDKTGRWTFLFSDFPQLLQSNPPPVAKLPKRLTDVIFVLDRSGSMAGLYAKAKENLQSQIDTLRAAADADNEYRISVINFDDTISTTLTATDVKSLLNTQGLYQTPHGMTKLNDAVAEAIDLARRLETYGKQHAFLISIVTDGIENASNKSAEQVAASVRALNATDRYTFAFAGPSGATLSAARLGILAGNVTEWQQTYEGITTLGAVTNSSTQNYSQMRSRGIVSSTSFYAQPVTPNAASFATKLDDKLDDVSGQVKVERVTATDPVVIQKFCVKKFGSFPKGQVYYQLTESEKVQDYKKLIVQDTATGNFYAGEKAKSLLGVPNFKGTVRIKPGSLGEFKVFVQSTSVNRKLTPGTVLVYLP